MGAQGTDNLIQDTAPDVYETEDIIPFALTDVSPASRILDIPTSSVILHAYFSHRMAI